MVLKKALWLELDVARRNLRNLCLVFSLHTQSNSFKGSVSMSVSGVC